MYGIKTKADMFLTSYKFLPSIECKTDRALKALHSNSGGKYRSTEMKDFMADEGILKQLTVPGNLQQNRIVIRLNRTLLHLFRPMFH